MEICPFAKCTRLLLIENGVPFTLTEVDHKIKPNWSEAISPYSKVPVLERGEDMVWESLVFNKFFEETHPEPPMLPKNTDRSTLARFWIDFCNVKFVATCSKAVLAHGAAAQEALLDQLGEHLLSMERGGIAKLGGCPYWMGADVNLVNSPSTHRSAFCR